jgi:hypothetical protein
MLEEGWGQSMGFLEQQEERVMPEALMACPGRVYGSGVLGLGEYVAWSFANNGIPHQGQAG